MIKYEIGNCLDLMKELPDKSFDIVLTSPPFKDEDVKGPYWEFYDQFFREAERVCSKVLIIIHSATKMQEHIARYPYKRLMIWGKTATSYAWRFNPIYVYQMSEEYKVNKYIWSDAFAFSPIMGSDSKKYHKYQDPEILYYTVLKMFKGCTSVLDPFGGSGTTALASRMLGLDCTFFEIDPNYEEIFRDRMFANIPEISSYT